MMKKIGPAKTLCPLVVSVMSLAAVAPAANAVEVSASAGVATAYLWRGFDLGDGSPAVFGDLVVSAGGAYGGIWISSGDDTLGNEYDLFVGYGTEIGPVAVDISIWNYNYPDAGFVVDENEDPVFGSTDDTTGELSELILSLGVGPVSFTFYENIAGAPSYSYYTLGAEFGAFSATVGVHDDDEADDTPTHLDLSYAYNDNLSFTVSKFIADEDEVDSDTQFVASYSFNIE